MRLVAAGATAVALLAFAGAAFATAPPKARYGCTIGSDYLYAGELTIIDGSHYKLDKAAGTYRTSGKLVTFTSGPFKGLVKGRWYITTSHRPAFAMTELKTGFTSEYCTKDG